MKIVVLSDTHGEIEECISVVNQEKVDMIIHLGDYSKDAEKIRKQTGIQVINVKGNCDISDFKSEEEKIIEINKLKILLTHGHKYGVKSGIDRLYYRGKELETNIVLFGHSHIPINIVDDNILFLNPGSISSPKGGHKKSYGLLEIGENIKSKIVKV